MTVLQQTHLSSLHQIGSDMFPTAMYTVLSLYIWIHLTIMLNHNFRWHKCLWNPYQP